MQNLEYLFSLNSKNVLNKRRLLKSIGVSIIIQKINLIVWNIEPPHHPDAPTHKHYEEPVQRIIIHIFLFLICLSEQMIQIC